MPLIAEVLLSIVYTSEVISTVLIVTAYVFTVLEFDEVTITLSPVFKTASELNSLSSRVIDNAAPAERVKALLTSAAVFSLLITMPNPSNPLSDEVIATALSDEPVIKAL